MPEDKNPAVPKYSEAAPLLSRIKTQEEVVADFEALIEPLVPPEQRLVLAYELLKDPDKNGGHARIARRVGVGIDAIRSLHREIIDTVARARRASKQQ